MKKIMFNDRFLLTQAVLEGRKTQTRRLVKIDVPLGNYEEAMTHSTYKVGDLPPVNTDCLFVYGTIIDKGYMREDKTISIDAKFALLLDVGEIAYWMEIPKLPEKENDK